VDLRRVWSPNCNTNSQPFMSSTKPIRRRLPDNRCLEYLTRSNTARGRSASPTLGSGMELHRRHPRDLSRGDRIMTPESSGPPSRPASPRGGRHSSFRVGNRATCSRMISSPLSTLATVGPRIGLARRSSAHRRPLRPRRAGRGRHPAGAGGGDRAALRRANPPGAGAQTPDGAMPTAPANASWHGVACCSPHVSCGWINEPAVRGEVGERRYVCAVGARVRSKKQ
jgi:hypothetical protein